MFKLFRLILFIVGGAVIILFVIPNSSKDVFGVYAASSEELKSYIKSKVDDQQINIPLHGTDSFGKFLWGLAGCESNFNERAVSSSGLYYGLYQYTPSTWESVNAAMGVATPDIFNGIAQIDATVYVIQTGNKGGFNNWPGCTDGVGREWTGFTSGWSSPPLVGTIRGNKDGISSEVGLQTIWLDGGSPSTLANTYTFSGVSAGVHTVHITLNPNDQLLSQVRYTVCNSTQPDCAADGDPRHYHWLDNLRDPQILSPTEAVVQVDVPSGGFVDLWWLFPPFSLPGTGGPPPIPPTPTTLAVDNLPECSDTQYGGNQHFSGPPNIRTTFTATGATKAEFESYTNGVLFYNSLRDEGAWTNLNPSRGYTLQVDLWNLSPTINYNWRVRAGNEGGWSGWVAGSWWNVPLCLQPPNQPFNLTVNKPSCSDNPYKATFSWQNTNGSSQITKTEFKLVNTDTGGVRGPYTYNYTYLGPRSESDIKVDNWYSYEVRFGNNAGFSSWKSSFPFIVSTCTRPDLLVTTLSADKSAYLPSETVNVSFEVKNNSTQTATGATFGIAMTHEPKVPNVSNIVCEGNDLTIYDQVWSLNSLAPGATPPPYRKNFQAPATLGVYKIRAWVDAFCVIDEADDDVNTMGANNYKEITYSVVSSPDNDGDGFSDLIEQYVGTDPNDKCPDPGGGYNTAFPGDDAWPPDINNDGIINVTDINRYKGIIPTPADTPEKRRLDLDGNGIVDIKDVNWYKGKIPAACSQ